MKYNIITSEEKTNTRKDYIKRIDISCSPIEALVLRVALKYFTWIPSEMLNDGCVKDQEVAKQMIQDIFEQQQPYL